MDDKIKVGVIGVGHLGQHHARIYSASRKAKLVAVVDLDRKRAQGIGRRYHAQAYTDYQRLVDEVDAVSIVVPTSMHYEIARDFLNWGVDVLVEKPFTNTLAEAEELTETARKRGLILQVGHSERFNPAVSALKEQLKDPRFIEVHRLGPFVARGLDVDVILDLMIHDLDIVQDIVPSPVKQIHASGIPVLSRQIDIATARLEFENGCVANITCSRVSAEQMRRLRIFQQAQYLAVDYLHQELTSYSLVPAPKSEKNKFGLSLQKQKIKTQPREPLQAELEAFLDCVRTRTRPLVSGEEGQRAMKLALDILGKVNKNMQLQFPKLCNQQPASGVQAPA